MKSRKILSIISLILAAVLLLCAGCANEKSLAPATVSTTQTPTEPASMEHLRLSVSYRADADSVDFTSDELSGNFSEGLCYCLNITGASIEIDGQSMPLNEALRDGFITEEEIFCNARLDAREGFCEETYESLNGLTNFTFTYPGYKLRLLYDIYECPDGEQRLISYMAVYGRDKDLAPCHLFIDEETGIIDREDWGLDFEVTEVSHTGLTLRCTQSGGQLIGQPEILNYSLVSHNGNNLTRNEGFEASPSLNATLQTDDVTELTIDWTEPYGELSSGEYEVVLWIKDTYDESQKHPLMRNFYDTQIYAVRFTVS